MAGRRRPREGLHEWYFARERAGVFRPLSFAKACRLIQGDEAWPWGPAEDGKVYLVRVAVRCRGGAFTRSYAESTCHHLTETGRLDQDEFDEEMRRKMEGKESGLEWQLSAEEKKTLNLLLAKKGCPAEPWADDVASTHLNPRGGRGSA